MSNLKYINEFKEILQDYRISDEGRQILKKIELVLFVGPTSSGRNTIINELLKSGKYHSIVSDTTRKPRENNGVLEQNGVEYWFRSEEDILQDLQNGLFLEAAIIHNQQVSGISMRELQRAASNQKIAVNEIEVVGADNIHQAKPDTVFLFVIPPSFDEWMVRMSARSVLPDDEINRRLKSAVEEITIALNRNFYHFIVNDTFKQTTNKIKALMESGLNNTEEQAHNREVAAKLLKDTMDYLSQDT